MLTELGIWRSANLYVKRYRVDAEIHAAMQADRLLEAGFVQVNQNLVVMPGLSYGGIKHSGYGKEASLEAMLEHFTHKKTIIVNIA